MNEKKDILEYLQCMVNTETPTPLKVVHKMIDLIDPLKLVYDNAKILCPCCKDGIFLREIVVKILQLKKQQLGQEQFKNNQNDILKHILKNRIFGIAISYRGYRTTKRTIYGCDGKYEDIDNIFFNEELGKYMQDKDGNKTEKQCFHFTENFNEVKHFFTEKGVNDMKFDIIIGNPPYQQNYGTAGKNASKSFPIFHRFIEQAIELNPKYISFIVPDKWMFGTKELNKFKDKFLEDERIDTLVDIMDGSSVFPTVSTGALCYFLWDRDKTNKNVNIHIESRFREEVESSCRPLNNGSGCFSRFMMGDDIIKKCKTESNMSEIVTPWAVFGVSGSDIKDSEKDENKYFYKQPNQNTIPIWSLNYHRDNSSQDRFRWYYVDRSSPYLKLKNLEKWKFVFPKTVAESIYRRTLILKPNEIFTDTWLNVFLDNKQQCYNLKSYFETCVFRFLLIYKTTNQNVYADAYSVVPNLQNIKNPRTNKIGWDSDWNDRDLQKLFNLTDDEMDYIKQQAIASDNGRGDYEVESKENSETETKESEENV